MPTPLKLLSEITTLRISIPPDLRSADSRKAVLITLRQLLQKYGGSRLPLLDALDMGVVDEDFVARASAAKELRTRIECNPIYQVRYLLK